MPTYEQAIEALKRADAAGNVEDARRLAVIANDLRSGQDQPQPEQAGLGTRLFQSVTDAGKAAFHGGTAGFGDEITGAALTPVFAAANAIKGEPFDLKRDYETGRATYNRQLESYREREPVAATAAEIGGGITTAAYAPGLKAMAAAPTASLAARTAGNVKQGAAIGAAYGAGEGEGIVDRVQGGITGGLVGGLTGAAATPVVDGVSVVLRNLANMTVNRAGQTAQTTVAARKAAEALLRDGLTPEQATAKIAQMGPEAALMDAGVNTRRLAGSISRLPGQGSQTLDDFARVRQEGARGADAVLRGGQLNRIGQALDDVTPTRARASMNDLTAQRAKAAGPLYDEAFSKNTVFDDRMGQFLDDPISKGGLKRGLEIQRLEALANGQKFDPMEAAVVGFNEAGDPIIGGVPNLRTLDAVNRGLGAIIREEKNPITGALTDRGRAVDMVRRSFVGHIDELRPEYAAARKAYSGPSQLMDALEEGKKFMSRARHDSPDDLRAAISKLSPDELDQFRVGAVQEIRNKLENLTSRADATKRLKDIPALEERVRLAFGDDATFQRYIGMLDNEAEMFKSYAEITSGAPTAQRMAADLDTNMDPGALAESVVDISANPMNISSWLRAGSRLAGDTANRVRMPEAQRATLAEILASKDTSPLYQRLVAEQAAAGGRQRLAEQLARGGAVASAPR